MSRSFDIKLDKISKFYQTFNMCAVHINMIAENFLICSVYVIQWSKLV